MTDKQEVTLRINLVYTPKTKVVVDLLIRNFRQLEGLLRKLAQ